MSNIYTLRCKGCGASVVYEPTKERLKCPFCSTEEDIPTSPTEIQEIDLEAALRAAENVRENLPTHKVLLCQSCGAQIAYKEARATCDFCGAEAVNQKEIELQPVKPQGVLPFSISREEALRSFEVWLKHLWFAPSDLRQRNRLEEVRGVYLPSWTFDAQVWAHWRAIPGYYRTRTERYYNEASKSWQSRTVQYIEWGPPISGYHTDFYDDVLVSGLKSLPTRYLEGVGGFATTTDLRGYEPAYLLGWDVALPDKPLKEAWQEGHEIIYKKTEESCRRAIPGDTHRDFSMTLQLSGLTTKLVYLPIFIIAYRYRGKPYRVVVHGRTGTVSGDRPISWLKVMLAILLLTILIGIIVYLSQLF
ncbi:MAG: hypothetical protein RMJ66_08295 [Bacteroidia bacterium]|nr:hypothetical protein [Bacteroidia bacterium]MDW8135047.1 hypothetical protein [Bacteroidia bacterium]